MGKKKSVILLLIILSLLLCGISTEGGELKRDPSVNPHDQINDEGEILYFKCLICHKDMPDVKKAKSIRDVNFLYEDPLQPCYSCHPQPMHPGGSWFGAVRGEKRRWPGAPKHWLVLPPDGIYNSLKRSERRYQVILPLANDTHVMCGTCHNPHERGLLAGKADIGADFERRWRTTGIQICMYCHEKG